MLYRPSEYPLMDSATIIVGCSTEEATKVFFEADRAIEAAGGYSYIAFFNDVGDKIGEVKVVEEGDTVFLSDDY